MARREFDGRAVVVTGAGGGIGRALCEQFARAGARIAALDLDASSLAQTEALLRERGVEVLGVVGDITSRSDCEAAARAIVGRFGGVDVLVNNAGVVHRSSFRETDIDVFRRVMEVNYFGALTITKALLESLIERRGLIVAISSIAGLSPLYGRSGYSASKHALHGLFESLRTELATSGVDVLMVCPSFTRSKFEQRAMGPDGKPVARGRSKVGREASPDEVAAAVLEAASAGHRLLVLSPVGKLAVWLSRIVPGLHQRLMVRRLSSELGT